MSSKWLKLLAACAAVGIAAPAALGQVVINEFVYDDEGTDDVEFVELFNRGSGSIDISGWTLGGRDPSGPNTTFTVPSGTVLTPGGYWVFGAATVPNVNQVVGVSNIWENDNESLELRDPAGALVDAVLYESNLGRGFAAADVLAQIGRGVWGNQTSQQGVGSTDPTNLSWSRRLNGTDTNNNGRDFGHRIRTPGGDNLGTGNIITVYNPPDVDATAPGTIVPGLVGSFRNPRVIDPTDTSTLLGTFPLNPNAIPPSPQGGNAIVAWDPTGGGNTAVSNDLFNGNGRFDIYAYFDTSSVTVPGAESTMYGIMGSTATFHNFPDPDANLLGDVVTSNGATGLAWVFNKNNAGDNKKLFLVDARDGGDSSPGANTPADWVVLQTIDMSNVPSAWYRLSIDYDAATGSVTAVFDDQIFNFTTDPGLTGEFYIGYRESLAGVPDTLRPPTFDIIPEPATLGLLAVGLPLVMRRRRG